MTMTAGLLTIYVLGVVVGLLQVDGPLGTKIGLALVWPLGVLAFILTISGLVGVAAIAFPTFGLALAVVVALAVWLWI
jgi:hypothetical protein